VAALHAQGLTTALVSGDHARVARAAGAALGIPTVEAETLPADKARFVEDLKARGLEVAFVGDGINDGPALAAADLGIAVGSGTDVAIEAGGVVLLASDPALVGVAIQLARRTFAAIRQNLFWAFFYNVLAIPLAALGHLDPMLAAALMALSSVTVLGNSLRLGRFVGRRRTSDRSVAPAGEASSRA
jgi:Cu+-exporting ATPase